MLVTKVEEIVLFLVPGKRTMRKIKDIGEMSIYNRTQTIPLHKIFDEQKPCEQRKAREREGK